MSVQHKVVMIILDESYTSLAVDCRRRTPLADAGLFVAK